MFSKTFVGTILLVAVILLYACATALYVPVQSNTAQGSDISRLRIGRRLYVDKCSSCHVLILPEKYSTDEWLYWVNDMAERSKLEEGESEMILYYLAKGRK